jgi:hypothetical protein
MEMVEIVDSAIVLLRRNGWCQGQGTRGAQRCLQSAVSKSAGYRWPNAPRLRVVLSIERALCRHIRALGFVPDAPDDLETVVQWNDAPGRRLAEVIALLEDVRAEFAAMTPDEVTHRERRSAPEPLVLPVPPPQPVTAPQPAEPVPAR